MSDVQHVAASDDDDVSSIPRTNMENDSAADDHQKQVFHAAWIDMLFGLAMAEEPVGFGYQHGSVGGAEEKSAGEEGPCEKSVSGWENVHQHLSSIANSLSSDGTLLEALQQPRRRPNVPPPLKPLRHPVEARLAGPRRRWISLNSPRYGAPGNGQSRSLSSPSLFPTSKEMIMDVKFDLHIDCWTFSLSFCRTAAAFQNQTQTVPDDSDESIEVTTQRKTAARRPRH
jgi:hypothetical protein